MLTRARAWLGESVDADVLHLFRSVLGVLLFVGMVRLLAKGWVHQAFGVPTFFFAPWPLGGLLRPLPEAGMFAAVCVLAVAALVLATGRATRLAAGVFAPLLAYVHFADLTNYLNHYWLVTLLTGILAVVPSWGRVAPRWVLVLLRLQVAVVYVFAGLAKLRADWLFEALPMRIWLAANTDVPLVGSLLREPAAAYVASWAGAAFDLTIPLWLSLHRTRSLAYAAVLMFHVATSRLFDIGMFPYLMVGASALFLDPGSVRRTLRLAAPDTAIGRPVRRVPLLALALYAAVQVALPLRARFYGGNLLWHEQGYRFAWNVMLMEKMGSAEFTVVDRATGQRRAASPSQHLTSWQSKAMATQPDMILAFAHHLADIERRAGRDVAVHADVFVVLNGRRAAPLVDPTIDLAKERDGVAPKRWIMPEPP